MELIIILLLFFNYILLKLKIILINMADILYFILYIIDTIHL
jgi:hypothetical protein